MNEQTNVDNSAQSATGLSPEIIRVHGTFAGFKHEKDPQRSDAWYLLDSSFSRMLKDKLGNTEYNLGSDFGWGGDNLSSSRNAGAEKLLNRLIELEEHKRPYHIIAHSHGGSVVWKALMMAQRRKWRKQISKRTNRNEKLPLIHLRSWTTIGTPFILSKLKIWREIFALLFQVGFVFVVAFGLVFLLDKFVITSLGLSGVYFMAMSYAVIILAVILLIGVFYQFSKGFYFYFLEYIKPVSVYQTSLGKWLGLMSPEDEALKGLTIATKFERDIVSGTSESDTQFLSSFYSSMRNLLFSPFKLISKYAALPIINRFIRSQLKKAALGDNDRFQKHYAVQSSPIKDVAIKHLPKEICNKLLESSNNSLSAMLPLLRTSLSAGVTAAGSVKEDIDFKVPSNLMTGRELIHTSYYNEQDVVELIATHILMSDHHLAEIDKQHKNWIDGFKKHICSVSKTNLMEQLQILSVWTVSLMATGVLVWFIFEVSKPLRQ